MEFNGLKIGVFTITDAINYGAFYQMFAMAAYLENRGASVTVYHCGNSIKRSLIKYLSHNPIRQIRKIRFLRAYQLDKKSVRIGTYKGQALDVAILGSDEIWNLDNQSFDHFQQYFGLGLNAKKIIAYAPSIGFANPETLKQNSMFCAGLNNIHTILARDINTQKVAQAITGRSIKQVADPTILFDEWYGLNTGKSIVNQDYILYYGYSSSPPFKDVLIDYAKSCGLLIVSAGYNYHTWCDKNYVVGPFGFINLIRGAKYIFTTTFHGTVMATLLNKQLACYGSGQKVLDFAEKLYLSNCHIDMNSSVNDLHQCLNSDLRNRRSLLEKFRDESRDYLNMAFLTN